MTDEMMLPPDELPESVVGKSVFSRGLQQAQECPRGVNAEEHRLGHYYHIRNRRSGLACIMDILPRQDLYKLLGPWELS